VPLLRVLLLCSSQAVAAVALYGLQPKTRAYAHIHRLCPQDGDHWRWLRQNRVSVVDQIPFITAAASQFDRASCKHSESDGCWELNKETVDEQFVPVCPTMTMSQLAFCTTKVVPT